jgi:hypothetical protein
MDRKQFIERIRSGSASFRVDDVTIGFRDGEISGDGTLDLAEGEFKLHLRLPDNASRPEYKGGVLTRAHTGVVRGVIDQDLQFEAKNIFPSFHYSTHSGRTTMLYSIDEPNNLKNLAWGRFEAIIKNAESYAAGKKFRLVGEYLGLKWEGDWQEVYKFWARWRPRLVHRGSGGDDGTDSVAEHFNIGSRVVGAIHMIVLRLMGYEGLMVNSTFEDQIRRI